MSLSSQYYMSRAIEPATRKAYESAVRNYHKFCYSRQWDPEAEMTVAKVREWASTRADQGKLQASTIRAYASGLRLWHTERVAMQSVDPFRRGARPSPNPFDDVILKRMLDGIEADKAALAQVKRRQNPPSDGITIEHVRRTQAFHSELDYDDVLMFAAMALGAASGQRPSEMHGSHAHQGRNLKQHQIRFFDADRTPRQRIPGGDITAHPIPDHLEVELDVSKTNKLREEETILVSAKLAVQAMWRWHHTREPGPDYFARRDGRPITTEALLKHMRAVLQKAGLGHLRIKGKCFRRGGTSALIALGAPTAEVKAFGRWKSNAFKNYTSAEAKRKATIGMNKTLDPEGESEQ